MIASQLMQATANRIKALRAARALTQEDLAALAGRSVASVQRIERGEKVGADTIASIAAAIGMSAEALTAAPKDDRPFLPLAPINGGRALIRLLTGCSRLDFEFDELDTMDQAEMLEAFHMLCAGLVGDAAPATPLAITRSELEARSMLAALSDRGFVVSGATLAITAHEVDDDSGAGIVILCARWDETIAVLRVGVGRTLDRAFVFDSLGQWETPNDDALVYPPSSRDDGDWTKSWSGIGSNPPLGEEGPGANV
ncbi:helix-turn-helix domain-containing protein [Alteraurantiacibacter palmitatis]|uniref:Helix-turn-helix domain-containing protein n=1 Tax=Alteraurantiacibacter palmitatis TaxID=2054628 RepID=A0ABV7E8Q3_9SPHN